MTRNDKLLCIAYALIAISVTFPLFLIARPRKLAAQPVVFPEPE